MEQSGSGNVFVKKSLLKRFASRKEFGVLMAVVVICVVLSIASPYFLKVNNIFNVLRQFSIFCILAVGEAYIIMTGGIDLSVGSMIGFTACIGGLLNGMGLPAPVTLILTLAAGCLIGLGNGIFVAKIDINPFIATLGMSSVVRGITLLLTDGLPVNFESDLAVLGSGYVGPVPVPVIIMAIVIVIGSIFASKTQTGRNIYAVGNNAKAAQLSGINVQGVKMLVYVITGFLAGISGIILAGNLKSADPSFGQGYEMDIIAAAVIGGVSLSGGEGSILGVVLGAALMGILRNGFILLGVSAYWQIVTIGLVILLAVSLDRLRKR